MPTIKFYNASTFALTFALLGLVLLGSPVQAQVDGPIVVEVEPGGDPPIEPLLNRCCRYVAVEEDPSDSCFLSGKAACTMDVPGFPNLKKCNGNKTSRVITTLFDRCEFEPESVCSPKATTQIYHVAVGKLSCPKRPKPDTGCKCDFQPLKNEEDKITKTHCSGTKCTTPLPGPVDPDLEEVENPEGA